MTAPHRSRPELSNGWYPNRGLPLLQGLMSDSDPDVARVAHTLAFFHNTGRSNPAAQRWLAVANADQVRAYVAKAVDDAVDEVSALVWIEGEHIELPEVAS